jgi:adenylate cyclase
MPVEHFTQLLEAVTEEARSFLHRSEVASLVPFEGMLDQVLEAFTLKVGEILAADRASVWLLDEQSEELWSKVARGVEGELIEIRIPSRAGIAGAAVLEGGPINVPDAYADPRFDRSQTRRPATAPARFSVFHFTTPGDGSSGWRKP